MSSESNYSFTTKIGNDLFTVRGDDFPTFIANLASAEAVPGVRHLVDILNGVAPSGIPFEQSAVAAVTNAFPDATVVSAPAIPTPPAGIPSVSGGRSCNHGKMTARQGTGKDGKIWRGYFCNAPQGATDKCKNIYIYPSMPEWHTFVAG